MTDVDSAGIRTRLGTEAKRTGSIRVSKTGLLERWVEKVHTSSSPDVLHCKCQSGWRRRASPRALIEWDNIKRGIYKDSQTEREHPCLADRYQQSH